MAFGEEATTFRPWSTSTGQVTFSSVSSARAFTEPGQRADGGGGQPRVADDVFPRLLAVDLHEQPALVHPANKRSGHLPPQFRRQHVVPPVRHAKIGRAQHQPVDWHFRCGERAQGAAHRMADEHHRVVALAKPAHLTTDRIEQRLGGLSAHIARMRAVTRQEHDPHAPAGFGQPFGQASEIRPRAPKPMDEQRRARAVFRAQVAGLRPHQQARRRVARLVVFAVKRQVERYAVVHEQNGCQSASDAHQAHPPPPCLCCLVRVVRHGVNRRHPVLWRFSGPV